jgi:hypothetical protein
MKRTTQSRKLNFSRKVILLLNEQQKGRIIGGVDTIDTTCTTSTTKTTEPRSCPSAVNCTTAPTDTCTR